jgi:diacylglycerol kinase (ATP)
MNRFSVRKRIKSFKYAFNGVAYLLKREHNVYIHLTIAGLVVILGFILNLSRPEWMMIAFAIGLVLMAEGMNTAIEHLANAITREYHPDIKKAKDIAAGAVLIAAISAALIGLLVFVPYLADLL